MGCERFMVSTPGFIHNKTGYAGTSKWQRQILIHRNEIFPEVKYRTVPRYFCLRYKTLRKSIIIPDVYTEHFEA